MKTLNYRLILTPEPEGGYTVNVPAIRGCITYGETVEEAIDMAKDAITGCLAVLRAETGKGSHHIYYNPDTKTTVPVPVHNKDLKKGTFFGILRDAGIDKDLLEE